MLRVGPNPYGLCCTLGLQGNAEYPKDIWWFIQLAEQMQARCIEFHCLHLAKMDACTLDQIKERLNRSQIEPIVSGPWPLSRTREAIPIAKQIGARIVRTHLSPILCGARAAQGDHWNEIVEEIRSCMPSVGAQFSDVGLILAIENHQDFGSDELLEFCEIGGEAVGIALDTGNPLAVCENPIAFTAKVAPKVRHVHLKDYRAQSTPEGFRLVRCAIGDGAIPLKQIEEILSSFHPRLTAAIEPGALEARHIKLLTEAWWHGYPAKSEVEIQDCLAATRINAIPADDNWRTPWERGEDPESVCSFELEQMNKSVMNMKELGWLP